MFTILLTVTALWIAHSPLVDRRAHCSLLAEAVCRSPTPLCLAAKSRKKGRGIPKRANTRPKVGGFGRPSTSTLGADPAWAAFRAWLESEGGVADAIELADCGGGLRGLRTTRDVASGEPLLAVPRHLLLDEKRAEDSPVSGLWRTDEPNITTMGKLALALLHEARRVDSIFAPYIELLPSPEDFAACGPAALWDPHEVALAENAQLSTDSAQRRKGIADSPLLSDEELRADRWVELGLQGKPPTNDDVLWAVACITSRALGSAGLVPIADLANHNVPHNADRGIAPDGSAFLLVSRGRMKAGQQVFITYGNLPNLVLLSQFGFMLASNAVDMTLARCNELISTAHPFLLRNQADGEVAEWQPIGAQLRAALFELAENGALPPTLLLRDGAGDSSEVANNSVSALADAAYAEILRRSLASYSTTAEEDRVKLAAGGLPAREAAAIAFRMEQKERLLVELTGL